MSSPVVDNRDVHAVEQVLTSGRLALGPQAEAFEDAIASYVGTKHAVAVNSGTSALHLAAIAARVGENDLVITTPFSFIASSNCVLYERAIPVFVDVDPVTGNLAPEQVEAAVQDLVAGGSRAQRWLPPNMRDINIGRLKAILPVDAFGQPADYDPILHVAKEYGLTVIEDSCEAIGAAYKGRMAGTLGDVGAFAFYPNKQITTGEGGMIVTDDDAWDALFRSLRNQGRDVFDAWLNHTRLGYNYRLDELSAALGLSQMRHIEDLLASRTRVAGWYDEGLADVDWIVTPKVVATTTRMSWFVYVVRVEPPAERNAIMAQLSAQGIASRPYFTPIHLQPFYVDRFGYSRGDYPDTEMLGDRCLALPFSSAMTEGDVQRVCDVLASIAF